MVDNNARVIDGASGPGDPIAPSRNKILLLGLLLGLAVPGVIFLMIMFLDTRIHTRKDIQGKVSAPFLGVIPNRTRTMRVSPRRRSRLSARTCPSFQEKRRSR